MNILTFNVGNNQYNQIVVDDMNNMYIRCNNKKIISSDGSVVYIPNTTLCTDEPTLNLVIT
mgnify:CR=1 FL=1